MGLRGEIFSTRIFTDEGRKTYFFNVKENRYRDTYINIVESRKTDSGFKRSSVVVFREDLPKFLEMLNTTTEAIRRREDPPDNILAVGGGRREYRFRLPPRGRPALEVAEKRQDATGSRRESFFVSLESLDIFLEGLEKAVSAIRS